MVPMRLTDEQVLLAARVGTARILLDLATGGRLTRGYHNGPQAARDPHGYLFSFYGAAAELAVCMALGEDDQFPTAAGAPDLVMKVAGTDHRVAVNVKHSARLHHRLILPLDSYQQLQGAWRERSWDWWYFLVLGIPPDMNLVGIISESKARDVGQEEEHRAGGRAIYVDQCHLSMPKGVMV